MPTFTARTLVTAIGTVEYPAITVGPTGLIEDISSDASVRSTAILTPTFFDVHVHGAAGYDVMDAAPDGLQRMRRFLASRGVSHFLPTTITAAIDDTLHAIERLADAIEAPASTEGATPLGIHLEGPFLSHAKRGVHPEALLQLPSIALFDRLQQAARGHVRLITLAPELPSACELLAHATAQGVRVSLGHSNATWEEAQLGLRAGAASATHAFNAMRTLDQREPGLLAVVLDTPDLFAELICDGIHVHPALVRLWLQAKGNRAILITDGISATGMPDGVYNLGALPVNVRNARCTLVDHPETIAGSVLTMDRAVANLQAFTGTPLAHAVRCASSHPAQMLGLEDTVASLRVGQPASFNQYTSDGRLEATYLHGALVG